MRQRCRIPFNRLMRSRLIVMVRHPLLRRSPKWGDGQQRKTATPKRVMSSGKATLSKTCFGRSE
jgi:hypothetical protein